MPAWLAPAATLLGGILSKPKVTSARENSRQAIIGQAQGAREAADKTGFNPLTLLGVSSALGPSESANYMGSAVAEAGLLLADGLAKKAQENSALSAAQEENQALRDEIQNLTLRPRVGGIYAQREAYSNPGGTNGVLQATGRRDPVGVPSSGDTSGGAAPGGLTGWLTQGRESERIPVADASGFFTIDNALTGGPVAILGDSEPWGIEEIIPAAIQAAPQIVSNYARRVGARGFLQAADPFRGIIDYGRYVAASFAADAAAERARVAAGNPLPDAYPMMGVPDLYTPFDPGGR